MDLIEQAIFTSAETDRSSGYQVVATSPGVSEADARELSVWGPSHDALLCSDPGAVSVNFHPLPSGAYNIGRTTLAGSEYSGRRGARVYTQCLIVSPDSLRRFANNPFALLKAASAGGSLRSYDEVPKRLKPLRLVGRAAVVDETLLNQLCRELGPAWLASLVQAALASSMIGIAGGSEPEQVIAGLINCLPPECRTQFSFSTGLKLSSRRPFRVVAVPQNSSEQRRAKRLYDLTILDVSGGPPSEAAPTESWAQLVHRALKSNRTSFLNKHLSGSRSDFSPQDLPALGLQLLEELDASSLENDPLDVEPDSTDGGHGRAGRSKATDGAGIQPGRRGKRKPTGKSTSHPAGNETTGPNRRFRQDHEPHPGFQREPAAATATKNPIQVPSKTLHPDSPEVLEKLERLDDLVFGAIAEKESLAEELKSFWPSVRAELGEALTAESREQYLRYALSLWERFVDPADPTGTHRPERAIRALDVLCVLFDEV
jgi:hypothetical protein